MPKLISVTVAGNTYNTIRDAWSAESPEGLPEITVRARLKEGWEPDHAFLWPQVEAEVRRYNKKLRREIAAR